MANFQSDYATGTRPVPVAQGSEVLAVRCSVAVTTALASADLLEFCPLPPDHIPVDCVLDPDDIDSGSSITISVGLLNSGKTDISTATADGGAVWISADTGARTGVPARPTTKAIWRVTPNATTARMFGAKITAAAATAVAGTVSGVLLYRAAHYGG